MSIEKDDIKQMYEHLRVFSVWSPEGLLNKVWFEILLYSCRRGQENLRNLNPSDFEIAVDDQDKEYVHRTFSEVTKNPQDYEPEGGRMYATRTPICHVASFIKYFSKRNNQNTALWQRPRYSFDEEDMTQYENRPLGKNALISMISKISKSASLSKLYTSHCVRATCITVLSESGFEAGHI